MPLSNRKKMSRVDPRWVLAACIIQDKSEMGRQPTITVLVCGVRFLYARSNAACFYTYVRCKVSLENKLCDATVCVLLVLWLFLIFSSGDADTEEVSQGKTPNKKYGMSFFRLF